MKNMTNPKLHTAEHILWQVLKDKLSLLKTRALQFTENYCRLGFVTDKELSEKDLQEITKTVNEIIDKSLEVNIEIISREKAKNVVDLSLIPETIDPVRVVRIGDFSIEACAGLHVKDTVIQDAKTKDVLMLGFMNKGALKRTIKNKRVTFWSRRKKRLWEKGETSGNKLDIVSISPDCDKDTLLILVKPRGPACHTGKYSCFGVEQTSNIEFLQQLYDLLAERKKELPKNSYTTFLFKQGPTKILEKIEEESREMIFAAKKESRNRLIKESADLLYHFLVLLVEKNIFLNDLVKELKHRRK